jgi:hypothetical protein
MNRKGSLVLSALVVVFVTLILPGHSFAQTVGSNCGQAGSTQMFGDGILLCNAAHVCQIRAGP